jgi:adenylate kinase family enzyme
MIKRIHIFGASGSGTTTLGKALADTTNLPHYDTDNYFWIKTDPPFQSIRERAERQNLLHQVLNQNDSWILSGSLCGWGDFAIPIFDLVVFLWLPSDLRMQRLRKREILRYGPDIEKPNHPRHKGYKEFLEWAAAYDTGGLDMRSKSSHEKWITTLPYQVIRIKGNKTIQENMKTVLNEILPDNALHQTKLLANAH